MRIPITRPMIGGGKNEKAVQVMVRVRVRVRVKLGGEGEGEGEGGRQEYKPGRNLGRSNSHKVHSPFG